MSLSPTFQAISREAGLAAAHIGIGVTALEYANYAEDGYYAHAFFALTIGFERTCKLALVVDHALRNNGALPSHNDVRKFGHKLDALLTRADEIAAGLGPTSPEARLPQTDLHRSIIAVLTDFASNVTRYYNLDFLTGAPTAASADAVHQWHSRVTELVIAQHYPDKIRQRHAREAAIAERLLSSSVFVLHSSETGANIEAVDTAYLHGAATKHVKPYTRMYVLQIARFLSLLMSSLAYASYASALNDIPHLSDFYRIFNNDDRYFRSRKTWSIYRL